MFPGSSTITPAKLSEFASLVCTLVITPMIQGHAVAYDSLLFTEDFFPLINSRLDPIVNPGKVSGHVHHVVGGSAFAATQDYASSRASKCTSSNLACDLSNYWTPQLYYWKYPLTNVDINQSEAFAAIPDDFRMLAGDIKRDDYDENKAVSFLCVDAQAGYDYTDYMPTERECLTLRPQLHFPECWNGVDSYKEDNSHVAYPIDHNPEGGVCPEGFQKIPHLFMESTYHIKTENIGEGYEWYPGCFVLANGDNHGFSLHADWLNGFPTNFLTDAFEQCYDKSAGLFTKDCPFIQQYRGDIGRDCVTEGDVINELVGQHYAIPALPGNNPEYNSSKGSPNYPKPSNEGYVEQASIVKASDQTGGICVTGVCTDYIGGDIVSPNPQVGGTGNGSGIGSGSDSDFTIPSSSSAVIPDTAVSGDWTDTATGSSAPSSSIAQPTSNANTASVPEGEMTMSILPISIDPVDQASASSPLSASDLASSSEATGYRRRHDGSARQKIGADRF
uniref:DUF1996 domain-containing protein n=1 Tax=Kwoniella dejecticola CBS 10117 TaxID=1296121 RepID=A0A1A6ACR8_9TREE|nr:uncharacterized protein I303_02064 [Kwoniella dejecticola CBS 10117]OBR87850.1 hypothetical protein I303_02064 [Kwoniella dejecticola CBS 10117]